MNKTFNRQNCFYSIALVTMLLLLLFVLFICAPTTQTAMADSSEELSLEEKSAMVTESDDLSGFVGKTIRDYETIRTIPSIERENAELTLKTATDDAIVQIVPKEYFRMPGDNLYIGREYGFFIHTENCPDIAGSNNLYSVVLVFDIINSLDMIANKGTAITTVEVIYQYEFIYLSPQENHYTVLSEFGDFLIAKIHFDVAHADIVIPLARGTAEIRSYDQVEKYYLNDISFGASLLNVQNLDYIDAEYDATADPGAFFIGSRYVYDGQVAKDGEVIAGQHAEWLYEGISLVGGIITLAPGTRILSYVLLVSDALVLIADIATSDRSLVNDVTNDCISYVPHYKTRLEQVQYDGHLLKAIGLTNNSEGDKTYVFGAGDNVRMEYDISSTPGEKVPYTWFRREIALNVVDNYKDFDTVATATSAHAFKLYEEDYVELDLDGGTAYLLPEDSNTFSFEPQYSGKYVFDFGSNSDVSLEVDGVAVAAGASGFVVDMEGGREYDLRVVNETDERLILDFTIDPTADRTVTVAGNDEYVVKLDLDSPQCIEISTDNSAVNVGVYVKNESGELEKYTPSEFDWTASPSLSMRFTAGEYYIVLENTTSSSVTANVATEDVPAAVIGENEISFGANWTYVAFTPQEAGGYVFALVTESSAPVQMALYDSNMQPIAAINQSVLLRADGFVQNAEYYIGVRTVGGGTINAELTIEKWENAFAWYVEGVKVQGQAKDLYVGWSYNIELRVNDSVIVRSFNQNNGQTPDQTFVLQEDAELNVTIPDDMPEGTVVTLHGIYSDQLDYNYYLNVSVVADTMVMVNGSENFETRTEFYLMVNDPLVEAINYQTAYQPLFEPLLEEYGTVAVNGTGALCIVADIIAQPSEGGVFEIVSIVYNGRTVEYATEHSSCDFTTAFGKGSGDSEDDPWIINCSMHYLCFELYAGSVSSFDKFWKLGADIDLSDALRYLTAFSGTLDGGGHTFTGLTIDIGTDPLTADTSFGWVEHNYGTIKNVTFADVNITGGVCHTGAWAFIGVVAGTNEAGGVIDNVSIENVNISVDRNMARIGGLVGVNEGTISDCVVGHALFGDPEVSMFSNADMGIICGENGGTVDGCKVHFVVINYYPSVANRSVGGIVGYCRAGTIRNCTVWLCKIVIIGTDAGICPNIGSVAGHVANSNMLVNNSAGCVFELDLLTDAQKVNCGGTDRQYGYEG